MSMALNLMHIQLPWRRRTVMHSALRNSFKINVLAVAAVFVFSGAALVAQNPAPAQSGQRTDGQIEMAVVQALDASAALKNDLITAATIQSQVTLSGTVASDADRQLAESIVAKVPGVTKVNNHLKVGNPADDPNAQGGADDNGMPPAADEQGNANPPSYNPPPANTQQQPGYPQQPQNYPQQPQSQPNYGQNQPPYGQEPGAEPGYPPPPPNGRPQYGQQPYGYPPPPPPGYRQPYPPQQPSYATARGPITVLPSTVLQVM